MKSSKSAELRELELREAKADAEKAEYQAEEARLDIEERRAVVAAKAKYESKLGTFNLYGYVTDQSCAMLEERIGIYARTHPDASVTLRITSYGGDVIAGLSLYDTLRTVSSQGHHVTTIVRGVAASIGAILLQAGDTRLVGAESLVMLHELSAGTGGKASTIKDDALFYERLNKRLFTILAQRSTSTVEELLRLADRKDVWLDSEETLALGLADEIR